LVLQQFRKQKGEESSAPEDNPGNSVPETSDVDLPAPPKRCAPVVKKSSSANKTKTFNSKQKKVTGGAPGHHRDPPKKTTAASRRRVEKERRNARAESRGGVYSSEEDFGDPAMPPMPRPKRAATKRAVIEVASGSESEGVRATTSKRRKEVGSEEEKEGQDLSE
jgi:hypothetical protein